MGGEGGGGGGYSCGASRCSLIVPGDCAASNCDPPSTLHRWSCQLHYEYEMIKTAVSKATTDNIALVRGLVVARLNVTGLCGVSNVSLTVWSCARKTDTFSDV